MWLKVYKLVLIKIICIITTLCIIAGVVFAFIGFAKRKKYPIDFKQEVFSACEEFSLSPTLVFAIIKVESDFNPNAVSNKGAVGLMQILPTTAEYIAKKLSVDEYDLFEPKTNIRFGVWYLRYLLLRFEDYKTALCAYNAGEGKVASWLKKIEFSTDGRTLSTIPYPETEQYLKKIEKSLKNYVKLYAYILDK